MPESDVIINNNVSGSSGITIAQGVDIGNGLAYTNTESSIKIANENWLKDYLNNTTIAWSSLSSNDQEVVKDGINKKGSNAEKYWLQHRALFESLNLEDNELSTESVYNWKNALLHLINFYEDRYYGEFSNQYTSAADPKPYQEYTSSHISDDTSNLLKKRTLKSKLPNILTMPNVIEKYVILALMINYPPSILSHEEAITEIINQHSISLLTNLLNELGSINSNVRKIQNILFADGQTEMKSEIIEYYNSVQYSY